MHHKYAKDGLVVVSLNTDDPADKDARQKTTQFLNEKKAVFTNLVLADKEDPEAWYKKLDLSAFPASSIHDREGKLVKRLEGAEAEELDKLVTGLLKK